MELWGFKLTGSGHPQIFSAPYWRNCVSDPKSFRGERTCSRSSITVPSLVGLGFHWPRVAENVEFFCLSVCSSRFWTWEIVRPISPWRRWSTERILMPLDRGRFVVVHPCSTFSDCCQLAKPLNSEVQKTAKIVFFAARGRQNKAIETKFGM